MFQTATSSNNTPLSAQRTQRHQHTPTSTTTTTGRSNAISSNPPPIPPPLPQMIHMPSSSKLFTLSNPYSVHLQQQQQHHTRYQSPVRGVTPPSARDGVPIANRRGQRRSKSADIWLDHKPPTTTKVDTVFQPKMSHKISVSKVELSDAKKSSKYLLTTQHQDGDGEIITNLIKVFDYKK